MHRVAEQMHDLELCPRCKRGLILDNECESCGHSHDWIYKSTHKDGTTFYRCRGCGTWREE